MEEALQEQVGPHQRLLLGSQLSHPDFLDGEIDRLDEEVGARMRPFEEALERADGIPGVGRRTAEDLLAKIGTNMSRFPTAAHLASWARVCPGNNESARKQKSGSTGHGNSWLRPILVQAAQAASHTKGTYLTAQYHRLAARRGGKRAIMAVAHTILVIIYHMLSRGTLTPTWAETTLMSETAKQPYAAPSGASRLWDTPSPRKPRLRRYFHGNDE